MPSISQSCSPSSLIDDCAFHWKILEWKKYLKQTNKTKIHKFKVITIIDYRDEGKYYDKVNVQLKKNASMCRNNFLATNIYLPINDFCVHLLKDNRGFDIGARLIWLTPTHLFLKVFKEREFDVESDLQFHYLIAYSKDWNHEATTNRLSGSGASW